MPSILSNNYLRRISNASFDSASEGDGSIHYLSHWPSVKVLKAGSSSSWYQCPPGLHLSVFGSSPSSSSDVRLRVFPPSSLHHFSPTYLVDSHTPLHFLKFTGDGFDTSLPSSDYHEHTFTNSKEYLFIPHDHLVSVLPSSSVDGHLLLSCFVDASNLNPVREALALAGEMYPAEGALLEALQPQQIDTSMDKTPSELTLEQYRAAYVPSANSNNANNAAAAATAEPEKSATTGGRNRRNKKGNSEFKSWQDNIQWSGLISSLVIPKPSAPTVNSVGRTNVTLHWTSSFVPSVGDKTLFGFRVFVCQHQPTITTAAAPLCHNVTLDVSVLTHPDPVSQPTLFSGVVDQLLPSSSYSFALSLLYDRTESSPSSYSPEPPVTTAPLTPPAPPLSSVLSLSQWSTTAQDPLFALAEVIRDDPTDESDEGRVKASLHFIWPIGKC